MSSFVVSDSNSAVVRTPDVHIVCESCFTGHSRTVYSETKRPYEEAAEVEWLFL
jgi:hypothetical protein